MRIVLISLLLNFGLTLLISGQSTEVIHQNSEFFIKLLPTDSINYDYKIKSIETIIETADIFELIDMLDDEAPENELHGILMLNNLIDTTKVFLAIKSGIPKLLECDIMYRQLNNNELKKSRFSLDTLGIPLHIFNYEIEITSFIEIRAVKEQETKVLNEERFILDSIDGVYIPKNLSDCFKQIDLFWDESKKSEIESWTQEEFVSQNHHGFGTWMRNNWGLWDGSRLSKYFNELGIYHADNMSGTICKNYHRYLNGLKIEIPTSGNLYLPDTVISY